MESTSVPAQLAGGGSTIEFVFAAMIASRRAQIPSGVTVSAGVVTWIMRWMGTGHPAGGCEQIAPASTTTRDTTVPVLVTVFIGSPSA
jgi:hypothetical protein